MSGAERGRRLVPLAKAVAIILIAVLAAAVALLWWQSLRPGAYAVTDLAGGDHGAHGAAPGATQVTEFHVDADRPADVVIDLTARRETVRFGDGPEFDGYTLNGSTPGPTIRARYGELVEVRLTNADVPGGVTLHWHGVDVPGAMDGVAGVTQDAVAIGDVFVYRFIVEQVGTFWYHSHQVSHEQVVAGLFGAIILEPAEHDPVPDVIALVHTYPGGARSIAGYPELRVPAKAGERVRVRIVNTDNSPIAVWSGTAFAVRAVDGTEMTAPDPVRAERVLLTAGGRLDVEVSVPEGGARIQVPGASVILGAAAASAPQPSDALDLLHYGRQAPTGFDTDHVDRTYRYDIGRVPGFIDGVPGYWWSVNGRIGDDIPMFVVDKGDVVRFTITNTSGEVHPMHLHGHHMLVLARNGEQATGSPWWVDSLDVAHGDTYEVVFVADNPGLWMDHCHNLAHAAEGLVAHISYVGVSTPFRLGHDTGNEPE